MVGSAQISMGVVVVSRVRCPGEKLLVQPFSIWNNLSIYTLARALNLVILMFSILYAYNKMDKVFCKGGLIPIRHKEFNEFIKGKGFKGRNTYKLRDLKAMFGFKPMITGSPVTISSNELEPTRFDSMSKASTSTGTPYVTLLYAKKNSIHRVHSNGKEYTIIYH